MKSAGSTLTITHSDLGVAYALAGKKDEARQIINELERASSESYVAPDIIGIVYPMLNEREKAFELFGKAIDENCSAWVNEMKVDPLFDSFRADERFVGLLRRIGLG